MLYFFHLRSDFDSIEDREGSDLPDLSFVPSEAAADAREYLSEQIRHGAALAPGARIDVVDENGTLVHVLAFASVLLDAAGSSAISATYDELNRRTRVMETNENAERSSG